jgi:hypothetical protein
MIKEAQVTYKNQTVQIQLEPETITKTETVIIDSIRDTVKLPEEKGSSVVISAILGLLIVLLMTMICCRYLILKKTTEKLDQQRIVKRSQTELTGEKRYSEVDRDSIVCVGENSSV